LPAREAVAVALAGVANCAPNPAEWTLVRLRKARSSLMLKASKLNVYV